MGVSSNRKKKNFARTRPEKILSSYPVLASQSPWLYGLSILVRTVTFYGKGDNPLLIGLLLLSVVSLTAGRSRFRLPRTTRHPS